MLHRIGSRIRNSPFLRDQRWLWGTVEPPWQRLFGALSRPRGYPTRLFDETFLLDYAVGSRYDRHDKREYEPTFYVPFVNEVWPNMTVFDIGAHVGIFTLGAARRVGREGRVFAFEPAPATIEVLERHIAYNGWSDRVEVVPMVVSDIDGEVVFYAHGASMANSMARENVEGLNPERYATPSDELRIGSHTLDAFCRARSILPDVIKIDVEGAEFKVLAGGREVLARHPVTIFCEVHPRQMGNCGSSLAGFTAQVDELGYRIEALDEPNPMGIFHIRIARPC